MPPATDASTTSFTVAPALAPAARTASSRWRSTRIWRVAPTDLLIDVARRANARRATVPSAPATCRTLVAIAAGRRSAPTERTNIDSGATTRSTTPPITRSSAGRRPRRAPRAGRAGGSVSRSVEEYNRHVDTRDAVDHRVVGAFHERHAVAFEASDEAQMPQRPRSIEWRHHDLLSETQERGLVVRSRQFDDVDVVRDIRTARRRSRRDGASPKGTNATRCLRRGSKPSLRSTRSRISANRKRPSSSSSGFASKIAMDATCSGTAALRCRDTTRRSREPLAVHDAAAIDAVCPMAITSSKARSRHVTSTSGSGTAARSVTRVTHPVSTWESSVIETAAAPVGRCERPEPVDAGAAHERRLAQSLQVDGVDIDVLQHRPEETRHDRAGQRVEHRREHVGDADSWFALHPWAMVPADLGSRHGIGSSMGSTKRAGVKWLPPGPSPSALTLIGIVTRSAGRSIPNRSWKSWNAPPTAARKTSLIVVPATFAAAAVPPSASRTCRGDGRGPRAVEQGGHCPPGPAGASGRLTVRSAARSWPSPRAVAAHRARPRQHRRTPRTDALLAGRAARPPLWAHRLGGCGRTPHRRGRCHDAVGDGVVELQHERGPSTVEPVDDRALPQRAGRIERGRRERRGQVETPNADHPDGERARAAGGSRARTRGRRPTAAVRRDGEEARSADVGGARAHRALERRPPDGQSDRDREDRSRRSASGARGHVRCANIKLSTARGARGRTRNRSWQTSNGWRPASRLLSRPLRRQGRRS